ncbi:MAG: glycosyltransferase, partial [Hymenobacter sp.]|nr:glycosyltransferase [Hymenobacter sp.]
MKILLSAYACDPAHGSEASHGFNWLWETASLGHEVWCFTMPWGQQSLEKTLAERAADPAAARIHLVFVPVPALATFLYRWQFGVYIHYLVWQYRAWRVARPLDQQVNFDLVHHVTYNSL